jgi:dual specificity tyrosine-phosphorylation-regulated kinase 2/3/4
MPDGSSALQGGRSRRGKPRGIPGSKDFSTALKGCDDPLFIDFLKRCLDWDPSTRMTPAQALRHAWLRRRLPKPPSENPPPSRRSSAVHRNSQAPKLLANGNSGQHNVLNNSSNNSNTVNNSQGNGRTQNNTTYGGGGLTGIIDADISKHTKLPKIGGGSNHNLRTGS